jgi:ParB family chromosome partitioning protein
MNKKAAAPTKKSKAVRIITPDLTGLNISDKKFRKDFEKINYNDIGTNRFQLLNISLLHSSPTNPRKYFNETELNGLAESIQKQGMINPITVRKNSKGYEIVAGERRYRAAKIAGLAEVPVIIRVLTDDDVYEVQIIENLQRVDIAPMDEARGYQNLLNKKKGVKYTVKDIADKVGKPESYVYGRLKLMDLIPIVQKALDKEEILFGHAELIAKLTPEQQKEALGEAHPAWEGMTSIREFKEWIQREILLNINSAPFKKDDVTLFPDAGACDTCLKRTGINRNLFPEFDKKDNCTDRTCFEKKVHAHIDKKVKEEKLLKVTNNSYSEKGILNRDQYKIADSKKDKCLLSEKAIIINGGSALGEIINICRNPECGKHWSKKKGEQPGSDRSSSGRTTADPDTRYFRKIELISQPERLEFIECACRELTKDEEYVMSDKYLLAKAVKRFYHMLDSSKQDLIAARILISEGIIGIPTKVKKEILEAEYMEEFPGDHNCHLYKARDYFYHHVDEQNVETLRKYLFIISLISTISLSLEMMMRDKEIDKLLHTAGEFIDLKKIQKERSGSYNTKRDKTLNNFKKRWDRDPIARDGKGERTNDEIFDEDPEDEE